MPVAVHTISFRGISGGIFICLSLATVLYVIGFATTAWSTYSGGQEGLWQRCSCRKHGDREDWFHATQAMISIGLIGLLLSFILACIYMCVHSVSKNSTILALVIVCFVSVLFMVIGFAIYGSKLEDSVSWSFAITVISAILTLVAGILSIVQMRQSGVTM